MQEAVKEIGAVVEGYYAAANARTLAQKTGVEMPIAQAAYEVLYEGRDVHGVVTDLMTRSKRSEHDESWRDKFKSANQGLPHERFACAAAPFCRKRQKQRNHKFVNFSSNGLTGQWRG